MARKKKLNRDGILLVKPDGTPLFDGTGKIKSDKIIMKAYAVDENGLILEEVSGVGGGGGGTFTFDSFTWTKPILSLTLNGATKTVNLGDLDDDVQDQLDTLIFDGFVKNITYNSSSNTITVLKNDGSSEDIPLGTAAIVEVDPIWVAESVNRALNTTENSLLKKLTFNNGDGTVFYGYNTDKIDEMQNQIDALPNARLFNYIGDFATEADLPTTSNAGDIAFVTDTSTLFVSNGSSWIEIDLSVDTSNFVTQTDLATSQEAQDLDTATKINAIKLIATDDYAINLLNDGVTKGSGVSLKPDITGMSTTSKTIFETYGSYTKEIDISPIFDNIDDLQAQINGIVSSGGGSLVTIDDSVKGKFTLNIDGTDTTVEFELDSIVYNATDETIDFIYPSGDIIKFDVSTPLAKIEEIDSRVTIVEGAGAGFRAELDATKAGLRTLAAIVGVNLIALVLVEAVLSNQISSLENRVKALETTDFELAHLVLSDADGQIGATLRTGDTLMNVDVFNQEYTEKTYAKFIKSDDETTALADSTSDPVGFYYVEEV